MQMKDVKLVLVDDDEMMRRALVRVFKGIVGIPAENIREARDGREGLALLREAAADLLWTDRDMPEMNGANLIRAVRQDPALASIKAVLNSGTDRTEEAKEVGADRFLMKPSEARHVKAAVVELLNIEEPPAGAGPSTPVPLAH